MAVERGPMMGLSMVELMVALLVAALFTGGVVMLLGSQSKLFSQQSRLEQLNQDLRATHGRLTRLLAQAEGGSIEINNAALTAANVVSAAPGSSVTVVFRVPTGFAIWPNDDATNDYTQNAVQLQWTNTTGPDAGGITHPCTLYIRNVAPGTAYTDRQVLLGNSDGDKDCDGDQDDTTPEDGEAGVGLKLLNFELWPLGQNGQPLASAADRPAYGYRLTLSGASALPDPDYENPAVPATSPLRHYRTATVSGVVMPRN